MTNSKVLPEELEKGFEKFPGNQFEAARYSQELAKRRLEREAAKKKIKGKT